MPFLDKINIYRRLTKDRREEKNLWVGLWRSCVLNIHYCLPGALWTNFMNDRGITPGMDAPYGIPSTFVIGPLATILVTPLIDRIKNRIRAYAWLNLLGTINIFIPPLIFCLGPESFRSIRFILITTMLFGWWCSVVNVARCGMDGVVACRTVHNSIRGRYFSIIGMAQGLLGIGIGVFVTWVAKSYDIRTALLLGSLVSGAAVVLGSWMGLFLQELPDLTEQAPAAEKPSFVKDLKKIFTMKEFKILMPANVLRGLGNGAGAYIFWIALDRLQLPPVYAGYVTLANTCAPFVGNFILWLTMDRFGAVIMIPASCIVIAVSLMGTILTESPPVFLGFLFLYQVALPVEGTAIPLAHYEIVPNEVMGAFSTVRLGLLSITGSISATLTGLLLLWFSPFSIFVCSAAIKLLSGALFCLGLILLKKHKDAQASVAA